MNTRSGYRVLRLFIIVLETPLIQESTLRASLPEMPAPRAKKPAFNRNIEALRGLAALLVVVGHIIQYHDVLAPGFFSPKLASLALSGHLSVLIFFILSGFVIGLNHPERLNANGTRVYIKKRFVRIMPIFWMSIIVAVCVAANDYPFKTILSNAALFSVPRADVLFENNPLWSLHYEVVCYLLFIPVSYLRLNPVLVVVISSLVGLANFLLTPYIHMPLLTAYAYGFAFWACGLIIARYFRKEVTVEPVRLIGLIFLIMSLPAFNVLHTVLTKVLSTLRLASDFPDSVDWYQRAIPVGDFAFLPFCFLTVLLFAGKDFRYRKTITTVLLLIPALTFVYLIGEPAARTNLRYLTCGVSYLISCFLMLGNPSVLRPFANKTLHVATWLGSISYGLYIIHFPVLIVLGRFNLFSGTMTAYLWRASIAIALSVGVAFVLEKKFQPGVRKWLR